jgi:hypothetical protein
MELRTERQQNPVADEVSALNAIIRPILAGILFALKKDVVAEVGGYESAKLFMLPRLYRPGDGDCGICFEYAVHDAILRQEPSVAERVDTALSLCRIKGSHPASILFGAEKTGSVQLIATAKEILTADSHLLYGARGRPVKLKRHIDSFAAAFRKQSLQAHLPYSINGVWKADLFVGSTDIDQWVGATVKTKQKDLEGAKGLRIGLIPCESGKSDKVVKDDGKNLIICPLPYDGEFVELFFTAWNIVVKSRPNRATESRRNGASRRRGFTGFGQVRF